MSDADKPTVPEPAEQPTVSVTVTVTATGTPRDAKALAEAALNAMRVLVPSVVAPENK